MGNRRLVGSAVAALSATLILAGCAGTSVLSSDVGVAMGRQAIGFTTAPSSGSSSGPSTGSNLSAGCPDSLKQGLLAGLPANDAVLTLNPETTGGVMSDPKLTEGFTASCAFGIAVSGTTVDELYFIDLSDADETTIATRVVNDGFVPGTIGKVAYGTQQIFTKGTIRIVIAQLTVDNVKLVLIAG